LFASEKPLSIEQIKEAFSATDRGGSASGGKENLDAGDIRPRIEALKSDYEVQGHGFKLFEVAGGYQIATDPRFAGVLQRFYRAREKKKLSQASLETLSIIAYRQPATRVDIEFIRGVNVEGALKTLLEKGLVKITGRKDIPGRPMLYGTTKEFLEHFGLASVEQLPALKEFSLKDIEAHLLPPEMAEDRGRITEDKEQKTDDRGEIAKV